MGLRTDLQNDLSEAFDDDLADAVKAFTLFKIPRVYNPTTGISVPGTAVTESLRGILSPYSSREVTRSNGSINNTDIKCFLLLNEVINSIEIGDMIEISSIKYEIIDKKLDPADATLIVQLR